MSAADLQRLHEEARASHAVLTPETCCSPDDPCECPWAWEPPKKYRIRETGMFKRQVHGLSGGPRWDS